MLKVLFILLPVVTVFTQATSGNEGFCTDYLTCMEKLEIKQRECLALEQNYKYSSSDACALQRRDLKIKLNGLHLRRTELARDCVKTNIVDALIAQSTLTDEQNTSCSSLHQKFAFAQTPSSIGVRRKRNTKRKTKKENNSEKFSKISDCRTSTKAWHKHCSALAHCCPLTMDCQTSTKEVMEQIFDERRKLRELKDECQTDKKRK